MRYLRDFALVAVLVALGLGGARAGAGEEAKAPAGDEAKTVNGLAAKLAKKQITRRWRGRERKMDVLVLELTNKGEKVIVLPSPLDVKLAAKDAKGKEVPAREDPRRRDEGEKKDEKKAVTVTIMKPGQKTEITLRTWTLNFPAQGKYTVWATVEVKPEEKELVAGLKLWSGKLKSNEVEWTVERVRNRNARGNRGRGNQRPAQQPAQQPNKGTAKDPTKKVEEF
jgi:hypothetical protein